jgi:hypothetical protein
MNKEEKIRYYNFIAGVITGMGFGFTGLASWFCLVAGCVIYVTNEVHNS